MILLLVTKLLTPLLKIQNHQPSIVIKKLSNFTFNLSYLY